mmetsp:Transcript_37396/g.85023  ORF Transcript_37396/g.85023 Transcript_37396/m.85023 type:complete len:136 (-) Transcript_37396:99-506(-)
MALRPLWPPTFCSPAWLLESGRIDNAVLRMTKRFRSQSGDSPSSSPSGSPSSYSGCRSCQKDVSAIDPRREELKLLQVQAAKLRATIARRTSIPGSNCAGSNVDQIVAHYGTVLNDLEQRISQLSSDGAMAVPQV